METQAEEILTQEAPAGEAPEAAEAPMDAAVEPAGKQPAEMNERELLQALLPETRDGLRYGAEPYVLPADVSAAPGHEGEAGWTWYTGSAGWYFRAVTEDLLGLHLVNGELTVRPTLSDYTARWRDSRGREYSISVVRGKASVTGGKMPPEGLPKGGKL